MEIIILSSNLLSSVENGDGAKSGEAHTSTSTQGDPASHIVPQTM